MSFSEIFDHSFMTTDPGWNTGIASWKNRHTLQPLIRAIKCPTHRIKSQPERLEFMYKEYIYCLREFRPSFVFIEGVEYFSNDLISTTSARRGDLSTLSYVVGVYVGACCSCHIPFEVITARRWKGQLTKEATRSIVKSINGLTYDSEHITDAVGMGFGVQGRLEWQFAK